MPATQTTEEGRRMTPAKRRGVTLLASLTLATTALGGSVAAQSPAAPASGGTIVVGEWQAASQLNPFFTTALDRHRGARAGARAPVQHQQRRRVGRRSCAPKLPSLENGGVVPDKDGDGFTSDAQDQARPEVVRWRDPDAERLQVHLRLVASRPPRPVSDAPCAARGAAHRSDPDRRRRLCAREPVRQVHRRLGRRPDGHRDLEQELRRLARVGRAGVPARALPEEHPHRPGQQVPGCRQPQRHGVPVVGPVRHHRRQQRRHRLSRRNPNWTAVDHAPDLEGLRIPVTSAPRTADHSRS